MSDKELILKLGGPAAVCRNLGFDPKSGGVQRVQNWMVRGIPPKVRLENLEFFKKAESEISKEAA